MHRLLLAFVVLAVATQPAQWPTAARPLPQQLARAIENRSVELLLADDVPVKHPADDRESMAARHLVLGSLGLVKHLSFGAMTTILSFESSHARDRVGVRPPVPPRACTLQSQQIRLQI